MNTADKQIADILAKYGEPLAGNVWRVQGTAVIYHKALERIAAQAKITFDAPTILRAERDEAVMLVTGRMGERVEWSVGEALINVNYRVSGKQAAYVWAMAEKRAKDRVILKLIELHGLVYSEEEADEFKNGRPDQPRQDQEHGRRQSSAWGDDDPVESMKVEIDRRRTPDEVTAFMKDARTMRTLKRMGPEQADAVRTYARERFQELKIAAESEPEAEVDPTDQDYQRGRADFEKGVSKCLKPEIRSDEARFRRWQAGWLDAREEADADAPV